MLKFFVRLILAIGLAFFWSMFGVVLGINEPGSRFYTLYGFGMLIWFFIGLWFGGKLVANKQQDQKRLQNTKDTYQWVRFSDKSRDCATCDFNRRSGLQICPECGNTL
jgi:hypothetical protein